MTVTSDEAALLAAIIAQPEEDTPRLVYADWLQEHGQESRATFIRVQVAIAVIEESKEPYEIDPEIGHTCCEHPRASSVGAWNSTRHSGRLQVSCGRPHGHVARPNGFRALGCPSPSANLSRKRLHGPGYEWRTHAGDS